MNKRPIEQARDADLRSSMAAMQRAAKRARELAKQTGTAIVISRNGVIEHLDPHSLAVGDGVEESLAPYARKG